LVVYLVSLGVSVIGIFLRLWSVFILGALVSIFAGFLISRHERELLEQEFEEFSRAASSLGLRPSDGSQYECMRLPFRLFERSGQIKDLHVGTWRGLDVAVFVYEWSETDAFFCAATSLPPASPSVSVLSAEWARAWQLQFCRSP
jgi:hypothetical protein